MKRILFSGFVFAGVVAFANKSLALGGGSNDIKPLIPIQLKHFNMYDDMTCKGFIDKDKADPSQFKYGHLGKALISVFSQDKLPLLWASPIMAQSADGKSTEEVCPEYRYFDQKNRVNLWIYILSYMAFFESSCDDKIQNHKAPDGTAQGLFQLFKGHEGSAYFKDRNGVYHESKRSKYCRKGDSINGERSLICTLSMLEDQLARGEVLFSNNSYWAVISPDQFGKDTKVNKKMHRKGPAVNPAEVIKTATNRMCRSMAAESGLYSSEQMTVIASVQSNSSLRVAQK